MLVKISDAMNSSCTTARQDFATSTADNKSFPRPTDQNVAIYITKVASDVVALSPLRLLSIDEKDDYFSSFVPDACRDILPPGVTLLPLEALASYLIAISRIDIMVVLGSLTYLLRLKSCIKNDADKCARGHACASYGLLVASLVLSAKYLNDNSLLNTQWAKYCAINFQGFYFRLSLRQVNCMEVELLDLLGWDLHLSLNDLAMASNPLEADKLERRHALRNQQVSSVSIEFIQPRRQQFFQQLFPCNHCTDRLENFEIYK